MHSTTTDAGVEIRSLLFTPTKSHDHYMPALAQIPASLELYGHESIALAFTDNPWADAPELERAIPSLKRDIVPAPDCSNLSCIAIPDDWSMEVASSKFQIENRCREIIDSLTADSDMHIAVDMEWPVDRDGEGVAGRVSVISIAFEKRVLVLLVSSVFRAHIYP